MRLIKYLLVSILAFALQGFSQDTAQPPSATQPHHSKKSGKSGTKGGGSSTTCGQHCGTERWAVKTLTDADASSIQSMQPKPMKVAELITQTAPSKLPATSRVPFEKNLVTVHALLIGWKIEGEPGGDQDFHIVIADPDDTSKQMIVEVPSPKCQKACSSIFLTKFQNNRDAVPAKLGQPATSFQSLPDAWIVDIVGPPLFDFNHGQIGLAPNCVEIHPVVDITFVGQSGKKVAANSASSIAHHCGVPAGGGTTTKSGGTSTKKGKT